ncbi:hypothetical protein [Rhodocyclus tenuis]|uniref:Uncharacterized protein n=1 Tax=Rhodocyclus tenuis TaxID=1066 RepID=A0A840G7Q6_RHOTE|nr:hypothetical protein [Rhodocyclus tenuis]MBB4248373.1 hypothetical protein [Rhodocyclus tenuis]
MGAPIDLTPYLWPEIEDGRPLSTIPEIAWDDPITDGLILAAPLGVMGDALRNIVDGKPPAYLGVGGAGMTDYGIARKWARVTDGSTRIVFDVPPIAGDNAGAVICSAGSTTTAGRVLAGAWGLGSGNNPAHYLGIESGGQVAAISTNNGSWQVAGGDNIAVYGYDVRHVVAGNFSPASRELFVDGVSAAVNGAAVSMSSPDKIMIGSYWYGPGNSWDSGWDGYAGLALWWARKLSPAEHERIKATAGNCVLRAPARIFAFVGADLGASLSAAAAASASATATPSAQIALAGIAVSSASAGATPSVSIPLSAAALAVSSAGAASSARVSIGAVALVQAAASAGVSSSVLMAASAAAQASGNADLAARIALAANALASATATAAPQALEAGGMAAVAEAHASAGALLSVSVALAAGASAHADAWASTSLRVAITAAGFAQAVAEGQLRIEVPLTAAAEAHASAGAVLSVRTPDAAGHAYRLTAAVAHATRTRSVASRATICALATSRATRLNTGVSRV